MYNIYIRCVLWIPQAQCRYVLYILRRRVESYPFWVSWLDLGILYFLKYFSALMFLLIVKVCKLLHRNSTVLFYCLELPLTFFVLKELLGIWLPSSNFKPVLSSDHRIEDNFIIVRVNWIIILYFHSNC